jgi:hypothetical protein
MSLFSSPAELISTLRTIYQHLLLLQPHTPYSTARLARLADQTEYCLAQWPLQLWPQYSRQGESIPAYAQVRHWVQQASQLLSALPGSWDAWCDQTLAVWRQAAYLLRRTLRLLT